MADTSLRDALSGLNIPALDNPWGIGAAALGGAAPSLINPYGKVGTNLGIGLGSVLLTALLGYQARQTAAEESITTNKIANELMALNTPEQRLARIEAAKGELPGRLTSRLLEFNTALQGQEKLNALDIAKQKALEEAKLEVEMSPLGQQVFERKLEQMREQSDLIGGRQRGIEEEKQKNRLERDRLNARYKDEQMRAEARLRELAKAGTLNNAQSKGIQSVIQFGNAAEDLIDDLGLETMSFKEFKAKMAAPELFGYDVASRIEQLKQPYSNALFGASVTDNEAKSRDIAFAIGSWTTPQQVVTALRSLKELRAKDAEAAIATASMRVPDLYAGIQEMRTPGSRFQFKPLETRFSDIEEALAPEATPAPTPNTAPTAEPGLSAEAQAAIAAVNQKSISEDQKAQLRQRIIARDRGQ